MKDLKFAANAAFFGGRRDRFNQFQPDRSLSEKIELIAQVEGVTGVELKYPRDFAQSGESARDRDVERVGTLIADHGLTLSAVNVDTKDISHFRYGALSAQSDDARETAASRLREGMDVAAALSADIVTTCPLAEGYDYAFQIDYTAAWDHFIDTVRRVVSHRRDVTLVLEYQPHEPYARILLGNVGMMLHVAAEVGATNFGANLDVGHSFAAGESPAESAALLARKGWLRYIHTNDNTGEGGDWDMMSGTVHFWDWLDLLYTLDRVGYVGWFSGDIEPRTFGPVAAYATNFEMIRRMNRLIERAGADKITDLMKLEGHTPELYEYLSSLMMTS